MANMSNLDANQVIRSVFNETEGSLKMILQSGLVPENYDEIALSYTGSDLTGVVYKKSGDTIATLALSYSLGNLTSVLRS